MDRKQFIKDIRFWDWKAYRDDHKDLNGRSQNFLLRHILFNGLNESRKIIIDKNNKNKISFNIVDKKLLNELLPNDFNWNDYISLHSDLKNMNEHNAKCHYILNGNYEGRNYKKCENKIEIKKDVNKLPSIDYNNYEKTLIINPIFGLGNRLRSIASAYSICKNKNMKLIINWIPDDHCDCLIEDLIANIHEYAEVVSNSINTDSLMNFKIYNYLETEKEGKKNEYIDDSINKLYIKSNCVLNNKYSYSYLNEFLQNLKWSDDINRLINSISDISNYTGMHIRMEGGAQYTSQSYEKTSNWIDKETELLFKYREISHVDNFINQINNILHKNPEQKFFIATDMKSNYEKLINIYGNDKIKILERNNFDRSKEQLYYAVADMILLSRCNQFYGSTWSSFSELVTHFQKNEVKKQNIFSKDFKLNDINKYKDKTLLNLPILKGNSVLLGCRNRSENLLKVLKTIIHYPEIDEIVVVDWNSNNHLYKNREIIDITKKEPKVKIYTVADVDLWIHTKVWNFGLLLCRYENIYKIDCEVLPNKDFINQHKLDDNIFYHGHWIDPITNKVKDSNRLQIVGSIFCKRNNLLSKNLWNENIKTYGWEDSDLYNRLKETLNYKYIDDTEFNFIIDNDNTKNYHNEKEMLNPKMKIEKNRILCDDFKIYKWDKYNLISEYELVDTENYIFKLSNEDYSLNEKIINKEILNKVIKLVKQRY